MRWINLLALFFLLRNSNAQVSYSLPSEDNYSNLDIGFDGVDEVERFTYNINHPKSMAQWNPTLAKAIEEYIEKNGCLSNVFELYRMTDFSASALDSLLPHLRCDPCWQKPKFIHQHLVITLKDLSSVQYNINNFNIRYRAKSENGYQWGIHHFVNYNNEDSIQLSTAFFQLKKKRTHLIFGDFIPITPLDMMYQNNLMLSSPWNILPIINIDQSFKPYTSSIPERNWRGSAYTFTFKTMKISWANDIEIKDNSIDIRRQFGSLQLKLKHIQCFYFIHDEKLMDKKTIVHGINGSVTIGNQIIQIETIKRSPQEWAGSGIWIKPILKNQFIRIHQQIEHNIEKLEWTQYFIHQWSWNKQWKNTISIEHKKEIGLWHEDNLHNQTLRIQADYTPQRHHIFYARYQIKNDLTRLHQTRIDGSWPVTDDGHLHFRLEHHFTSVAVGWLSCLDFNWQPLGKAWGLTFRQVLYSVPEWSMRIYMMDKELKGSMRIPAYSGKGNAFNVILQYQKSYFRLATKLEKNAANIIVDLQLELSF